MIDTGRPSVGERGAGHRLDHRGSQNPSYVIHDPNGTPLVLQTANGNENYYATDNLGSTTALINTSNITAGTYTYDPYGTPTTTSSNGSAAGMNPYRQGNGVYDRTTGWTQDGQRYNDTTTGAFTTPDTITKLADTANAAPYPYAADNPTNNIDPAGNFSLLGSVLDIGSAVAAIGIGGGLTAAGLSAAAADTGFVAAVGFGFALGPLAVGVIAASFLIYGGVKVGII